ncbi:MAG: MFS transporter [Burkholderiales bacterium]
MNPALRAFRHRNFRIFFAGQAISLIGTWLQVVALGWLVYRLTGSALMLGIAAAAQQLPALFLAPLAGVVADRVNRRRLLLATQAAACVQAIVLALLALTGHIGPWHVVALALVYGVIHATETPTRQAFLLELVQDRADLPNAIALQSMMFNGARFIGPSLAGLVLAASSEGWCFLLNAVSYVATLIAYARVRVPARPAQTSQADWLGDLAAGIGYALGFAGTRYLLALVAVVSFFSAPWQPLMPKFAAEAFGGSSRTLGFMIGAVGLGALAGTAMLARRASVRGLDGAIAAAATAAGLAFAAFALSDRLSLSLALLVVFGCGLVFTVAGCNTLLQTIVDEDKRGRVVSLHVTAFLGVAPIGNFLWGAVSEKVGVHWTVLVCGSALTVAGLWFSCRRGPWKRAVREIYVKRGIVPTARG